MLIRVFALFAVLASGWAFAGQDIQIELEVPNLDADPYFRPYVAIWLEDEGRVGKETIALWYQIDMDDPSDVTGKKWLKDLRQWWRKLGRKAGPELDAVTGATRKPGVYSLAWDYSHLPAGKYQQNVEAAREDGGRSYKRELVQLGKSSEHSFTAEGEFGAITIKVGQ